MIWMLLSACISTEKQVETKSLKQMTSLSFPAYFLSQSLVSEVSNDCFLPVGEDAQHWFPSPELVASAQNYDLIVQMGAGYEAWVMTASLPAQKLVSLDRGLSTIPLIEQTHSHGTGGAHEHKGTNPFTWLDPSMYRQQLFTLKEQLLSFPLEKKHVGTELLSFG